MRLTSQQQKERKQGDAKVLKSYRLKKSVVEKIEAIRLARGKATGKIPSASEILENLVLEKRV